MEQRSAKAPDVTQSLNAGPRRQPAWRDLTRQLRNDLHSERIWLLPVRAFIGLGWLRAGAEKLVDPGWLSGESLSAFLAEQRAEGQVVFPFYDGLIAAVFLPHAQSLSWLLLIGQLLAGLAIVAGCLSAAALLGSLFMNLNFLLVGEPNPSAFYLVIQLALLLSNAGAVIGLDAWLGRHPRLAWLAARPPGTELPAPGRPRLYLLVGLLCVAAAAGAATAVHDVSPAGSVHDPAMILTILAAMMAGWAGLGFLRGILPLAIAKSDDC